MSALQVIKIALEATKEKCLITRGLLTSFEERYRHLYNLEDIRKTLMLFIYQMKLNN